MCFQGIEQVGKECGMRSDLVVGTVRDFEDIEVRRVRLPLFDLRRLQALDVRSGIAQDLLAGRSVKALQAVEFI